MDDQEAARLNALVEELASDPGYATGKRKFPRPVSLGEAETIAAGLQDEVDTGVAAREAAIGQGGILPGADLASTFNALRANDL
ncbi:MAG: hypothetical protein H7138_18770, partial [Myxococcales bacterium]|nr:hypothetical protein [Myxococcales bacterium]